MSGTLLEQARSLHEDMDLLERAMYSELGDPANANLKRVAAIARDQVVSAFLGAHQERCAQASEMYEDKDGSRRDEINAMSGSGVFTAFYDQLKGIREYHRKHQLEPVTEAYEKQLLSEVLETKATEDFNGEEAEGRFLDMHALHETYLNVKGVERLDYCTYLQKSTDVLSVPKPVASSAAYGRYLSELIGYWRGFLKRTQPLMPLDALLDKAREDFESRWREGGVERWQGGGGNGANGHGANGSCANGNGEAPSSSIDLGSVETPQQLERYGMENLKAELIRVGLKCGGSLKERCERLFLLKLTPLEQIPKQHLAKGGKPGTGGAAGAGGGAGGSLAAAADSSQRELALKEEQAVRLGELLAEVVEETANMVEKKASRTYEEIERDLLQAAEEEVLPDAEEEEDDEEKPIYNPLNLPLGWDGKPIPYWLYKLHGLNLEFKCEICGNYSYWGPRAYERHFQEWRHAHGMHCLGIPNTKHFQGITLIEDAYTLWAKLKAEKGTSSWDAELDEEFEDKQGNVMNRKTYADLARQGLLD